MRQSQLLEEPPDRAGMGADFALHRQESGHFFKRDLTFGIHLRAHPVFMPRQFADTWIALALRRKRPSRALQFDHVIDEFDRHIEPSRC